MSVTEWTILAAAAATFLTRIGGHVILSRFDTVHPRVEAALNAVPAAVLTTLVAPAMLKAGSAEWIAVILAGLIGLRAGLMASFLIGAACLIVLRQVMG